MTRGLSLSVDMNGGLTPDTGDTTTRSLEVMGVESSVQSTVIVTSVSTVPGRVTLQVRVCEVPSYSGPLGTPRLALGVGTVWTEHELYMESVAELHEYLHLTLTETMAGVEVMLFSAAGETSVP